MFVYLDSSALIKLCVAEAETFALREFLRTHPELASSAVARVEVIRAARLRGGEPAETIAVMDHINLIRMDDALLLSAADVPPRDLRALDAIHLATALSIRADLAGMVVYDLRLADAARRAGLTVWAPA